MSDLLTSIGAIATRWVSMLQSVTIWGFSIWDVVLVGILLSIAGAIIGFDWGDD